jgi:hypothetical protein
MRHIPNKELTKWRYISGVELGQNFDPVYPASLNLTKYTEHSLPRKVHSYSVCHIATFMYQECSLPYS